MFAIAKELCCIIPRPRSIIFCEIVRAQEIRGISRRLEISRVIAAFLGPLRDAFAMKINIHISQLSLFPEI
jgi:hypothetical protein